MCFACVVLVTGGMERQKNLSLVFSYTSAVGSLLSSLASLISNISSRFSTVLLHGEWSHSSDERVLPSLYQNLNPRDEAFSGLPKHILICVVFVKT